MSLAKLDASFLEQVKIDLNTRTNETVPCIQIFNDVVLQINF